MQSTMLYNIMLYFILFCCFAFAGLDILFSMSLILICMFFQEDKLKKDAAANFEVSPQLV
jgi:SNF family Na+-dependent transporter